MSLGYDRPLYESDKKELEWLETAAKVEGFIGFAVGRTVFWEPLVGWRDNKIPRKTAVNEIARSYRQLVDVFEKARIA
jgi:5-dehydro-2-deoxygluconokinase